MTTHDTEALVAALTALAEANIPTDVQELLVRGDPMRGIAPGALAKAIAALAQRPAEADGFAPRHELIERIKHDKIMLDRVCKQRDEAQADAASHHSKYVALLLASPVPAPVGAGVKALDLSNLLKHAFDSGRGAQINSASWPDYDPTECAAFPRILSALSGGAAPKEAPQPVRNDEAGFVEVVNDDVPYIVRELDGPAAAILDMGTRNVIGYRVYDIAPKEAPALSGVEAPVGAGVTDAMDAMVEAVKAVASQLAFNAANLIAEGDKDDALVMVEVACVMMDEAAKALFAALSGIPPTGDACPVCANLMEVGDTCATDIELGTCHADCLAGSDVVNLDTGEPSDGPIATYPYEPLSPEAPAQGWRTMENAPKDGTLILAWCDHDADPYHIDDGTLTPYGCHVEALSRVVDGPNVLVWGGGYWESTDDYGSGYTIPDWWFRAGSEFEEAANPIAWMPLPAAPQQEGR